MDENQVEQDYDINKTLKEKSNGKDQLDKKSNTDSQKCVVKNWYFVVNVREGAPGWADDDTYQSEKYTSFEDCYRKYIKFSPARYWTHLRHINSECIVFQCGDKINKNTACDGVICYTSGKMIEELGITEKQFDNIINQIILHNKKKCLMSCKTIC